MMTFIQRPKLDKWFEQADELLAQAVLFASEEEEAAQDRSDEPAA